MYNNYGCSCTLLLPHKTQHKNASSAFTLCDFRSTMVVGMTKRLVSRFPHYLQQRGHGGGRTRIRFTGNNVKRHDMGLVERAPRFFFTRSGVIYQSQLPEALWLVSSNVMTTGMGKNRQSDYRHSETWQVSNVVGVSELTRSSFNSQYSLLQNLQTRTTISLTINGIQYGRSSDSSNSTGV